MRFRGAVKWLLHSPLGRFNYYGSTVYFPPKSWTFRAACEQGVYESAVAQVLQTFTRPHSVILDIGANIGLSAIPLLTRCRSCRVVSFEISPAVLPFLRRTVSESKFNGRWTLVESAVSNVVGETSFATPRVGEDQYGGMRQVSRSSRPTTVQVPVTTVDEIWRGLGRPDVSVVKCDVEGAEHDVLIGARECLSSTQAATVVEWSKENLSAYDTDATALLTAAEELSRRVFTIPNFAEICDPATLTLHMLETHNFLLLPRGSKSARFTPRAGNP